MATIRISVNANQAVGTLNAIQTALQGVGAAQATLNSQTAVTANAFGSLQNQLVFFTRARLFYGLLNELQSASTEAYNLARQVTEIRTISQDLARSSGRWTQDIIQLSNRLGASAGDVAGGVYATLSNNIRGSREETLAFVETAGRFAQVTQTSTTNAVELLSSALNSYKFDVTQADRVSGVLFNTIERGRIRADAIANTFGRVSVLAESAGLSFEELNSAIVVLSRSGLRESEVFTQLNGLVAGLIKPSEAMTETFTKLGFSSPATALRTMGLVNVLKLLRQETQGLTAEAAKDFANRRGLSGFLGLDTKEVEKELDTIRSASVRYQEGLNITKKSTSQALTEMQREFTNTFIRIATDAQETLVRPIQILNDLGVSVEKLTTLGSGAIGLGALSLLINRLGAAFPTLGASGTVLGNALNTLGLASNNAAQSMGILRLTFTRVLPVAGAFYAGLKLGNYLFAENATEVDNATLAHKNYVAQLEKTKAAENAQSDAGLSAGVQGTQALILASAAQLRALQEKSANGVNQAALDSVDLIKARTQSQLDTARKRLVEIDSEIQNTRRNIDKAKKDAADFSTGSNKSLIDFQLEFASPQQRTDIQERLLERLKQEAVTISEQAGTLTGAAAEARFGEARAALDEARKIAVELEKQKVRLVGGQVDTFDLATRLQNLNRISQGISNRQQESQNANINRPNTGLLAQREAQDLVFRQQERQARAFINLLEEGNKKFVNFMDVETRAISANITLRQDELKALRERNELLGQAEKLTGTQRDAEANLKTIGELTTKLRELRAQSDGTKEIDAINAQLEKAKQLVELRARERAASRPTVLDNTRGETQADRDIKAGEALKRDIDLVERQIRNAGQNIDLLKQALGSLQDARFSRNPDAVNFTREASNLIRTRIETLQQIEEMQKRLTGVQSTALIQLRNITGDSVAAAKFLDQAKEPSDIFAAAMERSAKSTKEIAENLQKASETLRNAPLPGGAPVPGRGFATGGMVGSGPGGGDNYTVAASAGEMMMSNRAVSMFGPTLRAMAAASRTGNTSNSNTSNTFNISVSGTGYAEKDARAIAAVLQRETRRGTL